MTSFPEPRSHCQPLSNFLFILPASTTAAEQEAVVEVARHLVNIGYVYLASVHEGTMEDRDGIRFMPWHAESPPAFGLLTGVFVVRDKEAALLAAEAYPDSLIWLIQPSGTDSSTVATTRRAIPALTSLLSAA